MNPPGSLRFFLASLAFLALILAACNAAIPVTGSTSTATPPAVKETVLVIVTATPPPGASPSPWGTTDAAPTPASTSAAPTGAATLTPSATPTLFRPTPTALLLANVPIEGGDPNNKFFALLVFPKWQPAATSTLWFQVLAHKPTSSKVDGQGIDSVDFQIVDSNGNEVYFREEKAVKYCAFGGGEPDCNIWNFASHGYTWPDGTKMVSGTYKININVNAKDGANMNGSAKFKIQVP